MKTLILVSLGVLCSSLFFSCTSNSVKEEVEDTNPLPSWAMGGFERPSGVNPIISPNAESMFFDPIIKDSVPWESNDTFNPGAVVYDGKVHVLYRAEDKSGEGIGYRTSRLGLASSADGIQFDRLTSPVFYPNEDNQKEFEWPGGVEDPRVAVTEDGLFVMFYTQWNRKVPRIGVATSKNLLSWEKHGPIFRGNKSIPSLGDTHTKSVSIVTELKDGKQVITKVNGKYWIYWGEHGVYGATSDDLVQWEPVVNEKGELHAFISPREGFFDSSLTECGPPAIVTEDGILLLYNGRNDPEKGDSRFNKGTYSAGQVLFDKSDPTKVIGRLDVPFLRPLEDFEKSGQYKDGTVFIQGLTFYKDKWYLYYGCADSRVAVAVYDPNKKPAADPLPVFQSKSQE